MNAIEELRTENQRAHELRATAEKSLEEQFQVLAKGIDARFKELLGALNSLNGAVQEVRNHTHVMEELLKARKAQDLLAQRTSLVAHQPVPVPPQPGPSTVSGVNNILANVIMSEGIANVDVEMDPALIGEQLQHPHHDDEAHMGSHE